MVESLNALHSVSKKTHIILECLVRELQEQGLRSFIIRSLHLYMTDKKCERNAVIGVFLQALHKKSTTANEFYPMPYGKYFWAW